MSCFCIPLRFLCSLALQGTCPVLVGSDCEVIGMQVPGPQCGLYSGVVGKVNHRCTGQMYRITRARSIPHGGTFRRSLNYEGKGL